MSVNAETRGWNRSLPKTSHVANKEKCVAWICLSARKLTSIISVNVMVVRKPEKKS